MTSRSYLARLGAAYCVVTVLIVLAISPYFSVGWDAQIFAGVGRSVVSGNPIDLYQTSRQVWGDWGFPYPPLYPFVLAPFVAISVLFPPLPDWIMVRVAPVLFDLALAVLLYVLIQRRTQNDALARLAAALWLFNPLTLYHTAIQAHQESTWLVCVVAAYALLEWGRRVHPRQPGIAPWLRESLFLPSLLMACAVTFKQSAILFYIPYVMYILLDADRRWTRLAIAGVLFGLVFGGLSLPFLLHSPDYFYLVYVDVSNMPVQTQSALVWLLGLSRYLIDQTNSTFFLLRSNTTIALLLASAMTFFALRRDRDMVRVGLLTALLFFLTSKKVMGYHYVLLVPFLLLYAVPGRRFDLIGLAMVAASWIIVSPYFAPWVNPSRLPLYAALATPNTFLWLWLFVHVWRRRPALRPGTRAASARLAGGGGVVLAICIITSGMIASCLVQPWADYASLGQTTLLLAVLAISLLFAMPVARRLWDDPVRLSAAHVALAAMLIPVYFAAFALTRESTRIIEDLLH